jgi:hypothetical protein
MLKSLTHITLLESEATESESRASQQHKPYGNVSQ